MDRDVASSKHDPGLQAGFLCSEVLGSITAVQASKRKTQGILSRRSDGPSTNDVDSPLPKLSKRTCARTLP